jgi:hypothetical protein
MVLLQPASDVQDIVTNNRGGFAAIVNAAYSGGYSDGTYGAAHNPKLFASTLAASGIPAWVAYASDDPTVIPSSVQSVVTEPRGDVQRSARSRPAATATGSSTSCWPRTARAPRSPTGSML